MKPIEVGCSVIVRTGRILIAQRKPGVHLGGYWEFPGGKRQDGESWERCLVREVFEELGVWIRPRRLLARKGYVYPDKKVALSFYLCDWIGGWPTRQDCLDFRWVEPTALRRFRFPLGDDDLINELIRCRHFLVG